MGHIITSSLFYGAIGAALLELAIVLSGWALCRVGGRGDEEYDD